MPTDINDLSRNTGKTPEELIKLISDGVISQVGAAVKQNAGKSPEQEQLEKQLAQMIKLTDGLEALNKTLDKVREATNQKNRNTERRTSGSESSSPREAKRNLTPEETIIKSNNLNKNANIFENMQKKAAGWAKNLGVEEKTVLAMLDSAKKLGRIDDKILKNLDMTLDRFNQLDAYEKKRIIRNAILSQQTGQQEKYSKRFAESLMTASYYSEKINKFQKSREWLRNTFDSINTPLQTINPQNAIGGHVLDYNMSKAAAQQTAMLSNVGQMTYALGGSVGDITKLGDDKWQKGMLNAFEAAKGDASELNVSIEKIHEVMSKNFRRGMTTDLRETAKTSILLSHEIGSNVDATADELGTWIQRFQLSNIQTRMLAQNIKEVGHITGVTGDNLLNAVKASSQLAENMRIAGNFTSDTNRALVQMTAVAQKYGTEKSVNPLIQGMQNRPAFMKMDDLSRSYLIRSAMEGGVDLGKLQMGHGFDTGADRKNMAKGMQTILAHYEQQLKSGIDIGLIDSQIAGQTGFGGLAEMRNSVKTFTEGTETGDEKKTRLESSKKNNSNLTDKQIASIDAQIAQIKTDESKHQISDVLDKLKDGTSLSSAMSGAKIDEKTLKESLADMAKEAGFTDSLDFSGGKGLNTIVEAIQDAQGKKSAKENIETDPGTKIWQQIQRDQNDFDIIVGQNWTELLKWGADNGIISKLVQGAAFGRWAEGIAGSLVSIASVVNIAKSFGWIGGGTAAGGAAAEGAAGGAAAGGGLGAGVLTVSIIAAQAAVITAALVGIPSAFIVAWGASDSAKAINDIRSFGKGWKNELNEIRKREGYSNDPVLRALQEKKDAEMNDHNEKEIAARVAANGAMDPFHDDKGNFSLSKSADFIARPYGKSGDTEAERKASNEAAAEGEAKRKAMLEARIAETTKSFTDNEKHIEDLVKSLPEAMENTRNLVASREKYLKDTEGDVSNLWNWGLGFDATGSTTDKEMQNKIEESKGQQLTIDNQVSAAREARKQAIQSAMFDSVKDNIPESNRDTLLNDIKKYQAISLGRPANWNPEADQKVIEMNKETGVDLPKLMQDTLDTLRGNKKNNDKIGDMADNANNPGSIFTHDIHIEDILWEISSDVSDLADVIPTITATATSANNETMMQNRIQNEFAGDASGSIAQANENLDQLNDYNKQQTDMMRQELEVLKAILAKLTGSTSGSVDTSTNSRPAVPPTFYEWQTKPQGGQNFGGINYANV